MIPMRRSVECRQCNWRHSWIGNSENRTGLLTARNAPFLMCQDIAANVFFFTLDKFDIREHAILLIPGREFGLKGTMGMRTQLKSRCWTHLLSPHYCEGLPAI